ncbi:hypothetical protein GQ44DRAFT_780623 [Phaeosphaeriaceae sp. PMI808]|nr:hypothetical protein GQ44DRAFT_780623 [Phaeosphaeriaceae sp. PMI808]
MAGGWSCFPNDKSATSLILGPASLASAGTSTRTPTSSLVGQFSEATTVSVSKVNTNPTISSTLAITTSSGLNNPTSTPVATSISPSSVSSYCIRFFERSYRATAIFLIAAFVFLY